MILSCVHFVRLLYGHLNNTMDEQVQYVLYTFPAHQHMARLMPGVMGVHYPEDYLPDDLLTKLQLQSSWKDDDGFSWGWDVMHAGCDDEGPYICVAHLYQGCGHHHQKVHRENVGIVDRFVNG